ncbi:MAG: hypothetical protein ACI8XG_001480 [Congregibacter sp.]|jgi:hypothetical protein
MNKYKTLPSGQYLLLTRKKHISSANELKYAGKIEFNQSTPLTGHYE